MVSISLDVEKHLELADEKQENVCGIVVLNYAVHYVEEITFYLLQMNWNGLMWTRFENGREKCEITLNENIETWIDVVVLAGLELVIQASTKKDNSNSEIRNPAIAICVKIKKLQK